MHGATRATVRAERRSALATIDYSATLTIFPSVSLHTEVGINNLLNRVFEADCLEKMKDIPDKSIDMILCDLPYGMTQNAWDSYICGFCRVAYNHLSQNALG
ncbi:MAG: hypothetical protein LBP89_08835 [Helicobacteraceae bacterium]|jgi:hypothetical protein|nr:hypothetical protein [Helicobacteraceae bacterium]